MSEFKNKLDMMMYNSIETLLKKEFDTFISGLNDVLHPLGFNLKADYELETMDRIEYLLLEKVDALNAFSSIQNLSDEELEEELGYIFCDTRTFLSFKDFMMRANVKSVEVIPDMMFCGGSVIKDTLFWVQKEGNYYGLYDVFGNKTNVRLREECILALSRDGNLIEQNPYFRKYGNFLLNKIVPYSNHTKDKCVTASPKVDLFGTNSFIYTKSKSIKSHDGAHIHSIDAKRFDRWSEFGYIRKTYTEERKRMMKEDLGFAGSYAIIKAFCLGYVVIDNDLRDDAESILERKVIYDGFPKVVLVKYATKTNDFKEIVTLTADENTDANALYFKIDRG